MIMNAPPPPNFKNASITYMYGEGHEPWLEGDLPCNNNDYVMIFTDHSVSISGEADGWGDCGKESLWTESLEEAMSGESLAERGGRGCQQHLDTNSIMFPHHLEWITLCIGTDNEYH